MKIWKSWAVMVGVVFMVILLVGAVARETGKLYLIVDKSTQRVLQMGISPQSVSIRDAGEELVILDGEKPTHLSENYFKLVDGKLVDMTTSEKSQVDSKIKTEKDDEEVAHLKAIMARDPAGFRQILGL